MAAAGKALQLVKPHVKRISFPSRTGAMPKWTGQNVAAAAPAASAPAPAPSPAAAAAAPAPMTFKSVAPPPAGPFTGDSLPAPPWPSVGALARGTGASYADLPAKYKRRTISDAEIDVILSGGAP